MATVNALAALRGITLGFGDAPPVLAGLDLHVGPGEFVVICGASGVGKSTLLRVLAGLATAQAGTVQLSIPDEAGRRGIGFVFQDARLLPWRRVLGNVLYGLEGLGLSQAERVARAEAALTLVGLSEMGGRWPWQLSGGQRQRVGLARALAVRPHLLLMDEPFGALDALTRETMQDELLGLWSASGASVVLVTHDVEEAAYLADRVVVLAADAPGAPAHARAEIPVPAARPRRRTDPALGRATAAIRRALGADGGEDFEI